MSWARFRALYECLNNCKLIDLEFVRPRFTWSNHRGIRDLIQECIDMAFTNTSWCLNFPEACVKHVVKTHSNHCLILIKFKEVTLKHGPKPFRLQKMWFDHKEFMLLVQYSWNQENGSLASIVDILRKTIQEWNKNSYGNVFTRKMSILARLKGIEKALKLLKTDGVIWAPKSRVSWLTDDDENIRQKEVDGMRMGQDKSFNSHSRTKRNSIN
ncbi:uncharacterized protein LOC111294765 [Durio zibethinus]|uniref:Uncharacterized protein LOC111294765 n=1 Tax=Durio zibethinus TaxID=66656 RepID=A0A6P5YUS8_DURZI|nr:uncharacterized protein LOC111294765 [Durio zibethinus]